MKRHLFAALCAVAMLSACGGGDSGTETDTGTTSGGVATPGSDSGGGAEPTPNPSPSPAPDDTDDGAAPAPTEVGAPLGQPVSKLIGAAGGQLTSADGKLTVEIPAGAFETEQTVSIQAITNQAHGAHGPAYRIRPEGLHTPVPMTLRFKYSDEDLLGTALEYLAIAYQDAERLWHVYTKPHLDSANRTLAIRTTHFSDWSFVAGVQILPNAATVVVGQAIELKVVDCDFDEPVDENGDLDVPMPNTMHECQPSPLDAFASGHWSVNGTEGGTAQFGTLVADADRFSGKAMYTAPAEKPSPNVVAVSVQHSLSYDNTDAFKLLVANIRIELAGCEGYRAVDRLNAELSFDSFSFGATAEDHTYEGQHAGRLVSPLTKLVNTAGQSFDLWASYDNFIEGEVSIHDTHVYSPPSGDGYSKTLNGNGSPQDHYDAPSFITLKLNYDTCTFDLFGSFTVNAHTNDNGTVREQVIGVGALYLYSQAIPLEQSGSTLLQGTRAMNAHTDIDTTGYVPGQMGGIDWLLTGATTARWSITAAP